MKGQSAAYIRVSSRAQTHAMQKSAIERVAAARGDKVARWYAEKASAKTMARPELQRLLDDVRRGRCPRLYVFRIDRLTRTGIRDTLGLVEELRRCGCELVTVADGFALDGPAADIILAVMAWAAQMERRAIGERIAAARVRVEREGGRWGRPRAVDRATADRAHELRAAGRSVRQIAQALKIAKTTLGRVLARPRRKKPAPG